MYVEEAHALDEWPIGLDGAMSQHCLTRSINQHKTDQDRVDAATEMSKRLPWFSERFSIMAAPISIDISKRFDAWPFGMWLMKGSKVIQKIQPEGDVFKIDEFIDKLLMKFFS